MESVCSEIPGPKMANLVEQGDTPLLPPARLEELGYAIAAYPLTLLSAAMNAMIESLDSFKRGEHPSKLLGFRELREIVGFDDYDAEASRYRPD